MFKTKLQEAVSGREARASFMAYPKYKIELQFDYLSLDDWKTLCGFFKLRRGRWDSFLFDDAQDNAVTDQVIGTGNGSNKVFQLVRTVGGYTEPVENVKGTPAIKINGVTQGSGYTISATGVVTFTTAPSNGASIAWTGGFYYRCRFNQDEADFVETMRRFFELKRLVLIGATGNKV